MRIAARIIIIITTTHGKHTGRVTDAQDTLSGQTVGQPPGRGGEKRGGGGPLGLLLGRPQEAGRRESDRTFGL